MRLALFALLVSACPAPAPRDASRSSNLQTACSSSSDCTHNSNGCLYCYGSVCSCVLPAEPPADAGVDAPGWTGP